MCALFDPENFTGCGSEGVNEFSYCPTGGGRQADGAGSSAGDQLPCPANNGCQGHERKHCGRRQGERQL